MLKFLERLFLGSFIFLSVFAITIILLTIISINLNKFGVNDTKQLAYVVSALALIITVKVLARLYDILSSDQIEKKE